MKILLPVRHPLTEVNELAIRRGLERSTTDQNAQLLILHTNELQSCKRLQRKTLRQAVESEFGEIAASYVVRDGFIVEEAIIEEAIRMEVDRIILSSHRRNRWKELLQTFLDIDSDPELLIEDRTKISVETVSDAVPEEGENR